MTTFSFFKGTKLGASPVTLVFEYFDNFHLFTKYDIYTEWRSLHKSLLNKEHLDSAKLPNLIQRCKALNNRITYIQK